MCADMDLAYYRGEFELLDDAKCKLRTPRTPTRLPAGGGRAEELHRLPADGRQRARGGLPRRGPPVGRPAAAVHQAAARPRPAGARRRGPARKRPEGTLEVQLLDTSETEQGRMAPQVALAVSSSGHRLGWRGGRGGGPCLRSPRWTPRTSTAWAAAARCSCATSPADHLRAPRPAQGPEARGAGEPLRRTLELPVPCKPARTAPAALGPAPGAPRCPRSGTRTSKCGPSTRSSTGLRLPHPHGGRLDQQAEADCPQRALPALPRLVQAEPPLHGRQGPHPGGPDLPVPAQPVDMPGHLTVTPRDGEGDAAYYQLTLRFKPRWRSQRLRGHPRGPLDDERFKPVATLKEPKHQRGRFVGGGFPLDEETRPPRRSARAGGTPPPGVRRSAGRAAAEAEGRTGPSSCPTRPAAACPTAPRTLPGEPAAVPPHEALRRAVLPHLGGRLLRPAAAVGQVHPLRLAEHPGPDPQGGADGLRRGRGGLQARGGRPQGPRHGRPAGALHRQRLLRGAAAAAGRGQPRPARVHLVRALRPGVRAGGRRLGLGLHLLAGGPRGHLGGDRGGAAGRPGQPERDQGAGERGQRRGAAAGDPGGLLRPRGHGQPGGLVGRARDPGHPDAPGRQVPPRGGHRSSPPRPCRATCSRAASARTTWP